MIKKYFSRFILPVTAFLFFSISACRKDDICTVNTTPDLQIKFFDYNDITTEKPVGTLYVTAIPQQDTLIAGSSNVIELSLPLNVNDDESKFIFTSDQNEDTLTFHYTREQVFVSKSCGYKVLFHQLNIDLQQDSDNWIKQIDIINNDVVTDTLVHLKIYH